MKVQVADVETRQSRCLVMFQRGWACLQGSLSTTHPTPNTSPQHPHNEILDTFLALLFTPNLHKHHKHRRVRRSRCHHLERPIDGRACP